MLRGGLIVFVMVGIAFSCGYLLPKIIIRYLRTQTLPDISTFWEKRPPYSHPVGKKVFTNFMRDLIQTPEPYLYYGASSFAKFIAVDLYNFLKSFHLQCKVGVWIDNPKYINVLIYFPGKGVWKEEEQKKLGDKVWVFLSRKVQEYFPSTYPTLTLTFRADHPSVRYIAIGGKDEQPYYVHWDDDTIVYSFFVSFDS